jgi:hypothetical protein
MAEADGESRLGPHDEGDDDQSGDKTDKYDKYGPHQNNVSHFSAVKFTPVG